MLQSLAIQANTESEVWFLVGFRGPNVYLLRFGVTGCLGSKWVVRPHVFLRKIYLMTVLLKYFQVQTFVSWH